MFLFQDFLLCLLEIEEQHTDEEVQEEEVSYQDEGNKEVSSSWVIVFLRTLVFSSGIYCLIHHIIPVLEGSYYEQS